MHIVTEWFSSRSNLIALAVTAGVAFLLACCLLSSHCSSRSKDELFRRFDD